MLFNRLEYDWVQRPWSEVNPGTDCVQHSSMVPWREREVRGSSIKYRQCGIYCVISGVSSSCRHTFFCPSTHGTPCFHCASCESISACSIQTYTNQTPDKLSHSNATISWLDSSRGGRIYKNNSLQHSNLIVNLWFKLVFTLANKTLSFHCINILFVSSYKMNEVMLERPRKWSYSGPVH